MARREERATLPDSPNGARPPGCAPFSPLRVARRLQTPAGMHPPRALERRKIGSNAAWLKDRKSTRLNSSHGYISYAVFCLKKKKKTNRQNYYKKTKHKHNKQVK